MPEAQFWALSPDLLQELAERRRRETDWEDHKTGLALALFANANRDPKQRAEPYEITDFMPHLPLPDVTRLSPEEAEARREAMYAAATTEASDDD